MRKSKPFEISKEEVWAAWQQVEANRGGYGVDHQSLEEFKIKLRDNLYKLWNRMSSGSYFPASVRGVDIPKANGGLRRLGIPTVSDRIGQAVIKNLLEPIVEPKFHDNSYGYRPGRSAHDAIAITRKRCFKYDWVLEFDIVGMFDNIPHALIMKAVHHHTSDKKILLYVERWLKAPMLSPNGVEIPRNQGVPQGGVISPLLMNLFMHYAFDSWLMRMYPDNEWVRYADDGLVHCRTRSEGELVLTALVERMKECGLELHPDKTRLVYCADGFRRGQSEDPKIFKFLGFDFRARNAKSQRTGAIFRSFQPGVSACALRDMRHRIKHEWRIAYRVDLSLGDIARRINPIVRGWMNYYGKFYKTALHGLCRYLNHCLANWARRKFKRLYCKYPSSFAYVKAMHDSQPGLFIHWKYLKVY